MKNTKQKELSAKIALYKKQAAEKLVIAEKKAADLLAYQKRKIKSTLKLQIETATINISNRISSKPIAEFTSEERKEYYRKYRQDNPQNWRKYYNYVKKKDRLI